jgi:hypothetical protein
MIAALRRRCGVAVELPREKAAQAEFGIKRTQYRMSHVHGTYVPLGVVLAASNAYVRVNTNKKKMGSAYGVVEPNEGR